MITQPDRFENALGISSERYRREWVECGACGALTNLVSEEHLALLSAVSENYYEIDLSGTPLRDRFDHIMGLPPDASDNVGRATRVRQVTEHWLSAIEGATGVQLPRQILDIGAGLGVFLSRFVGDGWTGTAVEPDPGACRHLREISEDRFRVVEGLFHGQPELCDFTLVTLNKVVEHVRNPKELVASIAQAMHPVGAVAYIEVPDKLAVRHRPPTDNALGSLHRHLYDPTSLSVLLAAAGLHPLHVSRVFEPSGKITVFAFATLPGALRTLAS